MTTAVRCAIRAALRAACAAQFSLRTCNTHARAPPPAEEPEYEIEEILKKRKRKNKEYDPEGEGEDAEPEYVEEYYVEEPMQAEDSSSAFASPDLLILAAAGAKIWHSVCQSRSPRVMIKE